MTPSEKIAISLPKNIAERARRAVRRGHAASVSAYVAVALEEKAKLDELSTLLDEMLAESRVVMLIARALEHGYSLAVPAGVVGQAWRDGRRQGRLARLLGSREVEVEPLDDQRAPDPHVRSRGHSSSRSHHQDHRRLVAVATHRRLVCPSARAIRRRASSI